MKVPAATAVPITPATFGPIACISRKLVGSASAPHLLGYTGRHRNCGHAGRTDKRIDLSSCNLAEELA